MNMTPANSIAAVALALTATAAQAATIAHWRFESNDWLADSSGNDHALTNHSTTNVTNYALPASTGAGASFYDPIPLTNAANGHAARRISGESRYLSAADASAFTDLSFTVESMLHIETRSGNGFLIGQWGGTQSSWAVFLGSSGQLRMVFQSPTGTDTTDTVTIDPTITLAAATDYYIGVAVDLSSATQAEREVTFYVKNLATNALQTHTVDNILLSSLKNSTNRVTIGAAVGGGNAGNWGGIVDEIRFSDTVLPPDQLLAVIPEPSTAMAAGALAMGLLGTRRRRR